MKCKIVGICVESETQWQLTRRGLLDFIVTHFIHLVMPPVGAALWRSLRAHQVYGANTDVGKTIISTVLCNAVQHQKQRAAFLKPVSTGALDDADDR